MIGTQFKRRKELLESVAPLLLERPFEQLSLAMVAERCGTSLWALRYWFKNFDGVFRELAYHLLGAAARRARYEGEPATSVLEAIEGYARFVADLMTSTEYQQLLQFLLRNSPHHGWLAEKYEARVVQVVTSQLEQVVRAAGSCRGWTVFVRTDAARTFHKRIETEFALAHLLPPNIGTCDQRAIRALRDIVNETFAATYMVETVETTTA